MKLAEKLMSKFGMIVITKQRNGSSNLLCVRSAYPYALH